MTYGSGDQATTQEGADGQTEFTLPYGDALTITTASAGAEGVRHVADGVEHNNAFEYAIERDGVDASGNYAGVSTTFGTLSIVRRRATITVDDASKVQGEADPELTGKVEGLAAEGDLGEVRYVRTDTAEETAEETGVHEGVLVATYTTNPDYDVTVRAGDFTIRRLCTVRWLDGDGGVLQSKDYGEGDEPPAYDGRTPTKAATARYSYAFAGWDGGTVQGAVTTYRPTFSPRARKYAPPAHETGPPSVGHPDIPEEREN